MGCFLISFCLGNTFFPFRNGLAHHMQLHRQFFLAPVLLLAIFFDVFIEHDWSHPYDEWCPGTAFSIGCIAANHKQRRLTKVRKACGKGLLAKKLPNAHSVRQAV